MSRLVSRRDLCCTTLQTLQILQTLQAEQSVGAEEMSGEISTLLTVAVAARTRGGE